MQNLFDSIAPTYDRFNGLISFNRHHRWRREAAGKLDLSSGDVAYDLCCGTGDFAAAIHGVFGRSVHVTGFDFSRNMLGIAQEKNRSSRFVLADASAVPARSGLAKGATIGWGLRNVPDVDAALKEAHRLLAAGGKLAVVESVQPKNQLISKISMAGFTVLSTIFGTFLRDRRSYRYLPESSERFLDSKGLVEKFSNAGFVDVGYQQRMFGHIAIVWGSKS